MRKFDTKVQHLKYKVLREVAREAWADRLPESAIDIPKTIVPGKVPTMRCCVYKERAILTERVKIAMGGDQHNPNVIEVIDIACDECPVGGYEVTDGVPRMPCAPVRGCVPLRRASPLTPTMWRTSTRASARSAAPAPRYARTAPFINYAAAPANPPARSRQSP